MKLLNTWQAIEKQECRHHLFKCNYFSMKKILKKLIKKLLLGSYYERYERQLIASGNLLNKLIWRWAQFPPQTTI